MANVSSSNSLGERVPKLRFPEFEGEWELINISDLLDFQNGINADSDKYGSGIKYISVSDILNNPYICYDEIKGSVDIDNSTLEHYKVEYGDIVFQRSSETFEDIGHANVYLDKSHPATFGGFVIRGKKKGNYNPFFFKNLLDTPYARKTTTRMGAGAQHYNIGQDGLSKIALYFPKINEQEKIANLFMLLNKKIQLQKELVKILKLYKRGVIEAIYNQKVRFKAKNNATYPKWIKTTIGELFNERNEKAIGKEDLLAVTINNGIQKKKSINSKDISNEDKSNYKCVLINDIAYNTMRMWQGASGVSRYCGIVSPAYTVITPKDTLLVDSNFYAYYFKLPSMVNMFEKYSQGLTSDTWNLKYQQLSYISIFLPSLEEQKEVVSFLTNFDVCIENANESLNQMINIKKYLLQQMFI